jgi:hypothetical protein
MIYCPPSFEAELPLSLLPEAGFASTTHPSDHATASWPLTLSHRSHPLTPPFTFTLCPSIFSSSQFRGYNQPRFSSQHFVDLFALYCMTGVSCLVFFSLLWIVGGMILSLIRISDYDTADTVTDSSPPCISSQARSLNASSAVIPPRFYTCARNHGCNH